MSAYNEPEREELKRGAMETKSPRNPAMRDFHAVGLTSLSCLTRLGSWVSYQENTGAPI